jgi:hypothetical protein
MKIIVNSVKMLCPTRKYLCRVSAKKKITASWKKEEATKAIKYN